MKNLVVILSILVVGLSAALVYLILGDGDGVDDLADRVNHTETIVTNLNGSGMIQASFAFEVDAASTTKELEKAYPLVESAIIKYLASHDRHSLQGTEGIDEVEDELKKNLNELLSSGEVINVYTTQKVVQ
ncbi:flagellar basal body-associated FliL family protein [Desertibacillus haloalkaliphilus]|uniref:flagellar basal body-associated FliL family protein n=1 Tax=Desertibacillus haloalkaliphilus TaxID=1328930 RepID=UPI001C255A62|nr:flagellar basal body-associated FliL family protein [Desertibacillus haloalkaliphilus]MBU8908830.1 flagellar basal body-associated FliL family protein [Desertibacillus haloalkaliphilus]